MTPSLGAAGLAELAIARAALTPAEETAFARYTFAKRQQDWLLGRLAAKRALAAAGGWDPATISIASSDGGPPTFLGPDDRLAGWDVSLTHGHGHALALAAPVPVGIDLEKRRAISAGGWRFFLAEDERAWLQSGPLGDAGEVIAWAAKEAAYKAWHGDCEGLHGLTLNGLGDGRGAVVFGDRRVAIRYVVDAAFCLAIATADPAPAWFGMLPLSGALGRG